jgi:hypothetical protein
LNLPLKYIKNNIPVIGGNQGNNNQGGAANKKNFSSTKANWHHPQFDNLNKTAIINFQAIQGNGNGGGRVSQVQQ